MWQITPETLEQPDEALGWELLTRLIFFFAERLEIEVLEVTEEIAKSELLRLAAQDSDNAAIAGLEKAYRRAVSGDIAGAGRLFRSYLLDLHKRKRDEKFAAVGIKFKPKGRGPGPIRKAIAKLLKAEPTIKNPEIWTSLKNKRPRGWKVHENAQGKYIEGPNMENMGYARFSNICGEERKKNTKGKNTS